MYARRERDRVSPVDRKGHLGATVGRIDVAAETTYNAADISTREWAHCKDLERLLELNAIKS
jgi:hypothetical protein